MTIDFVTPADKAGWLPLWQAYLDFYKQDLTEALTDLTFARFLDEAESMYMVVARDQGRVIGFASFVLHRSTWAEGSYCYLEDLYVDAILRGKGIARSLIAAVAEAGKAKGAERLYWITDASNTTAQALYDKVASRTDFIQFRRDL